MPRPSIVIEAAGQTRTLADWCRRTGLNPDTVRYRLKKLGWPPDQALGFAPRARKVPAAFQRPPKMVKLVYQGVEATLRAHCLRLGLPVSRTYDRYARGLPLERVFQSAPLRKV